MSSDVRSRRSRATDHVSRRELCEIDIQVATAGAVRHITVETDVRLFKLSWREL